MKEKRAIDFYLKHHDENTYLKEQELLENPEFQKLISKIYQPKEQKLIDWMNSPYKTNKVHPEQLIHRTRSDVYYSWEHFGFIDGNYKEV